MVVEEINNRVSEEIITKAQRRGTLHLPPVFIYINRAGLVHRQRMGLFA
jgi:hypothetical protein